MKYVFGAMLEYEEWGTIIANKKKTGKGYRQLKTDRFRIIELYRFNQLITFAYIN